MTRPINTRFGPYEIVGSIGVGGMGEVYRAYDNRLDRDVALKLLPEEFTQDAERVRRFIQEAKAASALNHPNIITIYEVGQDQGAYYIATELVDGETLRSHVPDSGVPLSDALDIATQLSSALVAAHEAGIVHRDIKPENIMIRRDGIVKVLDFGLAKLTEKRDTGGVSSEAETVAKVRTDAGTVMGTPQYMSPEQARGEKADERTDIFSFGVVLYEMTTGEPPFGGVNAIEVISEILKTEPLPLATYLKREEESAVVELQRIVSRALRKDREARYQTARELQRDLKALARELDFQSQQRSRNSQAKTGGGVRKTNYDTIKTTNRSVIEPWNDAATTQAIIPAGVTGAQRIPGGLRLQWLWLSLLILLSGASVIFAYRFLKSHGPIQSIAVVPFANETGNADLEYLSDGMTETLTNSLAQVPQLNVKARSSVFRFKGHGGDVKTIGRELDVQAVLNGRIVQRGNELTLYLSLVDAENEDQIWGRQYNRKLADIAALQTEIARDVSDTLRTTLSGADRQKVSKSYTTNTQAYTLYLQGRFFASKRTAQDLHRSIDYYNQAIALDPGYALAFAGLADSYTLLPTYRGGTTQEMMPKAKDAVLKALSLDNDLAEAHMALGQILDANDYDFPGSEREFKRALELNPNDVTSHQYYGELLSQLGRFDEALAEGRRALQLDPLSANVNRMYGQVLYFARREDEAIAQFRKALSIDANFRPTHFGWGKAYWVKGLHADAASEFVKMYEVSGMTGEAQSVREAFARRGWRGYLELIASDKRPSTSAHFVALVLAELGKKDEAFAQLERSYREREAFHAYIKVEPLLDPLRSDPRFASLLSRIGLSK
jgi:serine/threonine-protein kinase